jgi:hypothetical protein
MTIAWQWRGIGKSWYIIVWNSESLYTLGTNITNKNELISETEQRTTNSKRGYYALLPLLNSQSVLKAQNIKKYKT